MVIWVHPVNKLWFKINVLLWWYQLASGIRRTLIDACTFDALFIRGAWIIEKHFCFNMLVIRMECRKYFVTFSILLLVKRNSRNIIFINICIRGERVNQDMILYRVWIFNPNSFSPNLWLNHNFRLNQFGNTPISRGVECLIIFYTQTIIYHQSFNNTLIVRLDKKKKENNGQFNEISDTKGATLF